MASIAISNPTIVVNNLAVPIVPNSFSYTEGMGESKMRVESAGGGAVNAVYSQDVQTNLSTIKWQVLNTFQNIENIRLWKFNTNNNAITATSPEGFSRSFSQAAIVNDYEVKLGSDTMIEIEWKAAASV